MVSGYHNSAIASPAAVSRRELHSASQRYLLVIASETISLLVLSRHGSAAELAGLGLGPLGFQFKGQKKNTPKGLKVVMWCEHIHAGARDHRQKLIEANNEMARLLRIHLEKPAKPEVMGSMLVWLYLLTKQTAGSKSSLHCGRCTWGSSCQLRGITKPLPSYQLGA